MSLGPEWLLIGAVAAVGVLHTIVPDHWVPITLIARQRGWSMAETARAALTAGTGHVVSTLLIASVVWLGGVAVATQFGHVVDTAASIALVLFGGWIAVSAWRELRGGGHGHSHTHAHAFAHSAGDGIHGPELQRIDSGHGEILLSIYETGTPPRFRLTGAPAERVSVETLRPDGSRQVFLLANHGTHWESVEEIPEPHGFEVAISLEHGGHAHRLAAHVAEHEHAEGHEHAGHHHHDHGGVSEAARDPLYAPLRANIATLTRHAHAHRHRSGPAHTHWHDHLPETAHLVAFVEGVPPLHEHRHKMAARTALLVILGSSPMVEGIPAFFAAAKYGIGLILAMAVVFALSTIATYVLLCVYSAAGLQRIKLGAVERYGEVLSGAFIALVGIAFWVWPIL
jgi:nickel/cobalt transporter (NicO) family protein